MASITCQFVRPDRRLYEGRVKSLVLLTPSGELGVWPVTPLKSVLLVMA
jgi:F-type H+-transporting ATPase subunit epsilon